MSAVLSRQQAKFLSGYVSDLLAERPNLATAGEEAWCAAVTHFEFDAQTGVGERRVIRRLLAEGLFKYADEREDHVALAFSPAGAKTLHALHGARKPGAPRALEAGQAIKVYLDDASIERARSFGQGNVSKGIRLALAHMVQSKA